MPVLIGAARPATEGGGFAAFPFYRLAGLSESPSKETNARAAAILRRLGVREDKVQDVLELSVICNPWTLKFLTPKPLRLDPDPRIPNPSTGEAGGEPGASEPGGAGDSQTPKPQA